MKSQKATQMIRPVLTEILSIVIGVLLALAVNEWNGNRVQTERANEAIQNIISEIDSNVKLMGFVNKNNKAVIDLMKNDSIAASSEDNNQQFLPGLQIQDTAWKTLQSTGVSEYVQYSTLYTLSNLYSLQEIYKKLGYNLIQNIANHRILLSVKENEVSESIDSKVFTADMVLIETIESELLNQYTKTLAQLKDKEK
ncbi:MAG: hypothetical protein OQK09_08800 [Colwellia sp.]|nr:hypothetical protein [Colwellia sp.]